MFNICIIYVYIWTIQHEIDTVVLLRWLNHYMYIQEHILNFYKNNVKSLLLSGFVLMELFEAFLQGYPQRTRFRKSFYLVLF